MIKEEPIQRTERFGTKPKNKQFGNRSCRFCNLVAITDIKKGSTDLPTYPQFSKKKLTEHSDTPNWSPIHKCPALEANCNKCGKKATLQKHPDKEHTITEQ